MHRYPASSSSSTISDMNEDNECYPSNDGSWLLIDILLEVAVAPQAISTTKTIPSSA